MLDADDRTVTPAFLDRHARRGGHIAADGQQEQVMRIWFPAGITRSSLGG
jgi:hypothetical protein